MSIAWNVLRSTRVDYAFAVALAYGRAMGGWIQGVNLCSNSRVMK